MLITHSNLPATCIARPPGGARVTGSPTRKLLPRAVQQLKMLPTKSQFWHPRSDMIPYFDGPKTEKQKIGDLEWIKA